MCLQNVHTGSHFHDNSSYPRYSLILSFRAFGDAVSGACDRAGAGNSVGARAKCALLGWISANSRLCVVSINKSRLNRRYLFVVCVYAPTGSNFPEADDELY